MAATKRTVTLNNGIAMPTLAIGVFQVPDPAATEAVRTALASGYRSVDTAAIYGNENGVGRAIAEADVPRDELFIITKLWNADHGYDATRRAYDASLRRLGLDYIDLYLIHWPAPRNGLYAQSWKAMDALHSEGRVRAVGVSNFQPEHLERVADLGLSLPAVNQIEVHPAYAQHELQQINVRYGTLTQAWAPLAHSFVLDNPTIGRIANRYDKTPAQVVLRWHLQQGRAVIPKSVSPARIVENGEVYEFDLAPDDIALIDGLDHGGRIGPDPNHLH